MKRLLAGSILSLALIWQASLASPLEKIPTDSWVYPVIDQLYTAGLFPELHRSVRPYTRGQIADYLIQIRARESSGKLALVNWQEWLIEKLEDEFEYEIKLNQKGSEQKNQLKINPQGVFRLRHIENEPSLGRGQLFISGSWEWNNRFVLQTRGILDNRGEEDPNFLAQEWKKGLTGMFDRSYLGIRASPFYITLGRDYLRWGPGEKGLLLSSNAPALDFVSFEIGTGKLKFGFFTSRLDTIMVADSAIGTKPANRYISGHRLNFKHPAGWEIGLSEMIVYGGIDRAAELFYLNPVLPYYVEQYNQNVDDNSLWNLEFALTFCKNKEFYGELLIDDFQYDFVSEPNQLGYALGTRLADFLGWQGSFWNLQYTRIGTFVYGQQRSWNRYTYHDVVLGHFSGSDFDQWQVALKYLPHKYFTVNLGGSYTRQGEMTADSVYPPTIPKGVPFPSGVVEKTLTGSLGLAFQPDAHLIANLDLTYQDFKNYQHASGQKQNSWTIRLLLNYNFWKEFWL
jgi:hypothetical protein